MISINSNLKGAERALGSLREFQKRSERLPNGRLRGLEKNLRKTNEGLEKRESWNICDDDRTAKGNLKCRRFKKKALPNQMEG